MIRGFRHKGLRLLFEENDVRKVKADHAGRLRLILTALNEAGQVADMNQPTFRLHALRGDFKGYWAVTVRANWRVIFRFADGEAFDVDYVDYHYGEASMAMKAPCHPGELVKANLDELGLSVAEAAKAMRITRQQLYNVIRGKSIVTPEMAVRFEKAFGGTADFWLRMQMAYDLAQVRKRKMNIPRLVEHRAGT